ncbi:MAG: hypothetical protein HYT79_02400 [Elusimicrobia bacterium]|nr:hypothetical protein [Elusimicrobiota bacterium]
MPPGHLPLSFLGFGAWGGALAIHLARHGVKEINAWEYLERLRDHIRLTGRHPSLGGPVVPETIKIVERLEHLPLSKRHVLVVAVGSAYAAATLKALAQLQDKVRKLKTKGSPLKIEKPYACLILSKGLDPATLTLMSEMARRTLKLEAGSVFVLSGPTIAKELIYGSPTVAVLAGRPGAKMNALKTLFERGSFMIRTSPDSIGAQLGGAMKNIYALGYGVLDALGASANTKAFYLTRAMEEIADLALRLGGRRETIYGPAGLGDLLTTSLSHNSRNSRLGRLLAQGYTLEAAQREIGMVTEGVSACHEFLKLAARTKTKLTLAERISVVLKTPTKAREILLNLN